MQNVCIVGLVLILILYICTISYKKTLRKQLHRKEHRLLVLYGMTMFLIDRTPKKIRNKDSSINIMLKKLIVKEDVQKERYLYLVKKVSISIVVILCSLTMGLLITLSEKSQDISVSNVKRDNLKIVTYEFVAENEKGQKETVIIYVKKRELTTDEIYKLLEKMKRPLIEQVLGENENTECVNKPLNLINSIGDEKINISWDISDDTLIDYNGNILENAPEQGSIVNLTAIMTLNNISINYVFSINVFPPKGNESVQQKVQKHINENYKNKKTVELPTNIDGHSIKYYIEQSKAGGWVLLVGVLAAISIFFLKNQDLKKNLKERNNQLLKDYPEIVSKILLYYGAGLSFKMAIERIVSDYKKEKQRGAKKFRYGYEELEMALTKINSGVPEKEAISDYGSRCGVHCYIKFAGIIEQNLKRGSREVSYALKNEVNNAMLERKNAALKEGGEISTKLLAPMVLMLVISISIIILPAFLTINF